MKLIRFIRDFTSCFGPKRLGSNLLINRFNDIKKSFFHTIQDLIGENILPNFEFSEAKTKKFIKEHEQNL